jgi:hypothetical protein
MSSLRCRRAAAALALIPLWGCALFSGECGESRVMTLYGTTDGSDVRDADQHARLTTIGLSENRGRAVPTAFERNMQWTIYGDVDRGAVTSIRLFREALDGPQLLYDLPVEGALPAQQVVASGYETEYQAEVGGWYRGTVPFVELMVILYLSPSWLEIHYDLAPAPVRIPLGTPRFLYPPEDPREWHTYYCS